MWFGFFGLFQNPSAEHNCVLRFNELSSTRVLFSLFVFPYTRACSYVFHSLSYFDVILCHFCCVQTRRHAHLQHSQRYCTKTIIFTFITSLLYLRCVKIHIFIHISIYIVFFDWKFLHGNSEMKSEWNAHMMCVHKNRIYNPRQPAVCGVCKIENN